MTCRLVLVLPMLAAALGACSVMDSTPVSGTPAGECTSALGAYALPRGYLSVAIQRQADTVFLGNVSVTRRPDNDRFYCLEHLASGLASDSVAVGLARRAVGPRRETMFLSSVRSQAIDQPAAVIRRIVRIGALFTAANGETIRPTSDPVATLLSLDFDPFDQLQSARSNEMFRRHGFCLVLESFTFNVHATTVDAYCSDPLRSAAQPSPAGAVYLAERRALRDVRQAGLYYRPRIPYRLSVYTNAGPDRVGAWRLARTEHVELENASPLVAIRVDRAAFTTRRVALVFEEGALRDVCVERGSEFLGALSIPLEVVRSVVALPTVILQIRYDQVSKSRELIEVEQRHIAVQRQYLTFLDRRGAAPTQPGGRTVVGATPAPDTVDHVSSPILDDPGASVVSAPIARFCASPSE